MESNNIQNGINVPHRSRVTGKNCDSVRALTKSTEQGNLGNSVSFTGSAASTASKKGWLALKRLCYSMKDANEITNAIIAAIGTGIIAPLVILGSPGKGDKEDKDKKFFQAIRQPLSAILALAFQVPATIAITRFIDKLAYEKHIKMFNDKNIGALVPDEKYLAKGIKKSELQKGLQVFESNNKWKKELTNKIKDDYKDVGLDNVSDDEIAKRIEKEKKNFVKKKLVQEKRENALKAKIEELKDKYQALDIKETDFVTEGHKRLAIQRNQEAYKAIEKNAGLSFSDKLLRAMGFSNKKLKALKEAQEKFAKEKGLEILKEMEPGITDNPEMKLRKLVEKNEKAAQKAFAGKKYWLSLLVNLFMVSASCFALNWAHPRLKDLINKIKDKHTKENNSQDTYTQSDKKVEVA